MKSNRAFGFKLAMPLFKIANDRAMRQITSSLSEKKVDYRSYCDHTNRGQKHQLIHVGAKLLYCTKIFKTILNQDERSHTKRQNIKPFTNIICISSYVEFKRINHLLTMSYIVSLISTGPYTIQMHNSFTVLFHFCLFYSHSHTLKKARVFLV